MPARPIAAALVLVLFPAMTAAQSLPESFEPCRRAEDPRAGIAACEDALKSPALLQTERARALVTLAAYHRQVGELPAALAALDKAAAIAPNAPLIPAERAVALHMSGDLSGAMKAHARAFALEDRECEEVTYEGERLYLCDGVLYRATMYKDEPVYEIVTEPDEVIAAGGSVGAYEDDRPLMLTSPRLQGDRVPDLQQALADRGFDPGSADGVFGPRPTAPCGTSSAMPGSTRPGCSTSRPRPRLAP